MHLGELSHAKRDIVQTVHVAVLSPPYSRADLGIACGTVRGPELRGVEGPGKGRRGGARETC